MLLYAAVAALLAILVYALHWMTIPLRQSMQQPHPTTYTHEYLDPASGTAKPFPSLYDPASVTFSLIVPAYNEEGRMHTMMEDTLKYLQKKFPQNRKEYEIIIVDDGSRDGTTQEALKYSERLTTEVVRVLTLKQNQGKGGAVQQGMLHARGQYLLMVDADGASEIRDLDKMEQRLKAVEKDGHGIAVGSRAHMAEDAVAKRKWYRNILMYGFHFVVTVIGGIKNIKDTQCGFKLFTRKTAQVLFFNQRLRRWCFDIELLHVAQRLGYIPTVEVPISWQEIPGSKLNLIESSFQMGRDVLLIRCAYTFGLWSVDTPASSAPSASAASQHTLAWKGQGKKDK